ncbi:MAG: ACP S-malonyltransferase [Myxococcaceae bacterium]
MTLAFVFPGQGARNVLEAVEWVARSPQGRALVDRACTSTGCRLEDIRRHAGRLLESTRVLQPVLTAVCLTTLAQLQAHGVRPDAAVGHSLGELAALSCAGRLRPEEAIELAAVRGAVMEAAAAERPGGLVAVASLSIAREAMAAIEGLELALINAPDEVVIAGSNGALAEVLSRFPGRRVAVSGPWHSTAMQSAVEPLRRALPKEAPAVIALPGGPGSVSELPARLVSTVDFVTTLQAVRADAWLIVGPGHVLRGLLRRTLGASARILTTENEADLHRTLEQLRSVA